MTTEEQTFTICEQAEGSRVFALTGLVNTAEDAAGEEIVLLINHQRVASVHIDRYHYFEMTDLDTDFSLEADIRLRIEGMDVEDKVNVTVQ
ncbi:hypothetical protein [Salisediminibacterium halotolerans]|uniref:hypothetical protein n=1 Tax=Salisediminibacterium halotolerans TaxID=517425 RepID=UPI000EABBF33|nr:hypothetical protein [Salisediminibacterium halotolerans]RLJ75617.1 hypothetical protein BCL39_1134 [Actinophytocola xinjiangensis]RPE89471.1 hypothetical protein EDD67_0247 [Salisediminibacterium halotolerans]TWG36230.1 hypothetical protein BCL52_1131 [Salisediminibacterium halotolerans]GEL08494.1 hypothetical protein SHA02_19100 [Salisediminibacterium halotolerans]